LKSEQRLTRRATRHPLITHFLANFTQGMHSAYQRFKAAFEILRHVQPVLFIDIQPRQDTW
jgi:hypothetical protein